MAKGVCIQTISLWEQTRIHLSCVMFGLWVVFKRLVKWLCNPTSKRNFTVRDSPPSCLIDSSLGQHKYIKIKGVKFHYVECGNKDQPLLLLLHGFPDFWLGWRYQIPILSVNFRVVALDLKGFGDSDKPVWRNNYRLDTILEELREFIYSLGVNNCIVIGHDLGGLLGWYLTHHLPSLVTKFFVIASPHPNYYWKTFNKTGPYECIKFVHLPYLPEIDIKNNDKIIDQYYSHLVAKDMQLEAYKYTFCRKEDWSGPINYYRNLAFSKIDDEREIAVPVIVIYGSNDKVVDLRGVVKSTEFCTHFRIKIVDGCGHFPHQENPEAFNNILLKYLSEPKTNKNTAEPHSTRLLNGFLGAVSNTVKYGTSVIGTVQKKTNGVVNSIPTFSSK
ncbi:epoxide hydrolase 4-like [Cylas formicarius]|uniref:epoxide hydrolase 4-like n=1 Tax=Cylas formicarius TaxID=197179 RepID=UPI0029588F4B|nr:epoxide hydrolase 4-like [Cylas formicarius]